MTDIPYSEAIKLLGITRSTLYSYISRNTLTRKKPGTVTQESLDTYLKRRNSGKRKGGQGSWTGRPNPGNRAAWARYREEVQQKLLSAVLSHFLETGSVPTYDDLCPRIGLAKSGVGRYVQELEDAGKLEIYKMRIYLPGMREHIKTLVKEKYATKTETQAPVE